jgi:hypothetical protein
MVTIGLAYALAYIVSRFVIRYGLVRNSKIAFVVAVFATFITLYYSWAIWATLQLNSHDLIELGRMSVSKSFTSQEEILHFVLNPTELFEIIDEVHQVGTWTLTTKQNHEGGGAVKGGFLITIWAVEALITIVLPIKLAMRWSKFPYSEKLEKWLPKLKSKKLMYINSFDRITDLINAGRDLNELFHLQKNKAMSNSVIILYGELESEKFLTLINHQSVRDGKNKLSLKRVIAENQLKISDEFYRQLKPHVLAAS